MNFVRFAHIVSNFWEDCYIVYMQFIMKNPLYSNAQRVIII